MTTKQPVKHIVEEGSRNHVVYWDIQGQHCSEPDCEMNTLATPTPSTQCHTKQHSEVAMSENKDKNDIDTEVEVIKRFDKKFCQHANVIIDYKSPGEPIYGDVVDLVDDILPEDIIVFIRQEIANAKQQERERVVGLVKSIKTKIKEITIENRGDWFLMGGEVYEYLDDVIKALEEE